MISAKDFRRELHQIPELSGQEFETKKYLTHILKENGLEIYEAISTAVLTYIPAGQAKTICFRADMDGLPIEEQTGLTFSSKHKGCMHACGHDGHMAMLLEYALWAKEHKEELAVNVVCLFQHSEEENAGALDILSCGILEQFHVEEIYAFHLWPGLEEKKIYVMPKAMLASSSEMDITFFGKGVHAANRSSGIDALYIASSFMQDCYHEFSKISERHLLSFGTFEAGTARNIVASSAILRATIRNYSDSVFQRMLSILESLKAEYEDKTGIRIEIAIRDLYKSVINDESLFRKQKKKLDIQELSSPYLQAEDFGCYTRSYKGLFMLLGTGSTQMLHTNTFDFNMEILATGVEAYKKISRK